MKYTSILFILFFIFVPFANAQEIEDTWNENLRPEHIYQYSENGVRRLPQKVGSRKSAPLTCVGSPKVPVVLVQFADRPFHAAGTTSEEIVNSYNLFFNGKDNETVFKATRSRGSITNYFHDQSLGMFNPEFVVIGPITLDKGYAEYGKNNGSSKDSGIYSFYKEALSKSVKDLNIDWTQFDNDKNGSVDMVFFIHAGWGENTVSAYDPDAIWAKESTTSMSVEADDGSKVVFACYGVCAEARPRSSAQLLSDSESGNFGTTGYNPENLAMDGIGVCVHELSHALGLPDFYDTRNVAFGMDLWSIMDYGEYGNNGYNPGGYTAYERDFMGWQELVELKDTCILNIPCFADGGCGYKIVNEANEDEYYVIENRQPKGWDDMVCSKGRGLQVTHVDYTSNRWTGNSVNTDPNHQRMTIIAANNSYKGTNSASTSSEWMSTLAGNLFPYIEPSQSLTNTTVPADVVYAGEFMNKPLYDITQNEDSTVTVYFLKSKAAFEKELNDVIQELGESSHIDVYAMNGMHICRCQVDELYRMSFRHGVYVIKFSNGKIRKVLLK